MTVIYPINGKNERMGSLFSTSKHLLLLEGKELILRSINTINSTYQNTQIIVLTNEGYYDQLYKLLQSIDNVSIELISKTNSHVDTLKKVTPKLVGPVMFIDCDIVPFKLTKFDESYPTVFTFNNTTRLLNYSNYKANQSKTIIDCNEKQKLYKNAGAGIYYFPDVNIFNQYSENCSSVSECIKCMMFDGIKTKLNTDSAIGRYGTLQDIYVDNFSFRQAKTKNLSTGFTDNLVIKSRRTVIKVGNTVSSENTWYESYKNKKHTPSIIGLDGNTMIMEYIRRDADINLDDILELIDSYKSYEKLNTLDFQHYRHSIQNHLQNNPAITNGQLLIDHLNNIDIVPTFCHGDLSIMNIIPTRLGLRLIDPLYSYIKFGSYELDIAKLCFSLKFYKNDSASYNYIKDKANLQYINVLIAAESVRVASYKKEYSFIAENLINELVK